MDLLDVGLRGAVLRSLLGARHAARTVITDSSRPFSTSAAASSRYGLRVSLALRRPELFLMTANQSRSSARPIDRTEEGL